MSEKIIRTNHFYAKTVKEAYAELDATQNGLTKRQADDRIEQCGFNEIQQGKTLHPVWLFFRQFNSILIYILFAAAVISYIFDHMVDVYVIIVVVILNAIVGFLQEYKAERSIQALRKMMVPEAKVYRDGRLTKIPARELVPGDVISLEGGDRVPADARVIFSDDLRVVESALTGESSPINKHAQKLQQATGLGDRKNMLWMGTYVVAGEGNALVVATGESTALGSVAKSIQAIKRGKSHFEEKMQILAMQMGTVAIVGAIITFLIGFLWRGLEFADIFLATIAILVSGIPEGLPAVLTIVLAVSAIRMSRRNAIARSLPAVETLGIVTAVITDKTGTLTENTMNIRRLFMAGADPVQVTGNGWEPRGQFSRKRKSFAPLEDGVLSKLLHIAGVCNKAQVYKVQEKEKESYYSIIGDPTEAALVVLAEKAGLSKDLLNANERVRDDLPFSSSVKFRASLVDNIEQGTQEIFAVGAPEVIVSRSSYILDNGKVVKMTDAHRERVIQQVQSWSRDALRVIALAYRENLHPQERIDVNDVERLVFVGITGMIDTPREGVKDAVARAKEAGIRVVMATGDHKETAVAIAKSVGLVDEEEPGEVAYTEQELNELSKKEFERVVAKAKVFARLSPKMKLRLTKVVQKQGNIVAVTGDGVNDALALKQADIGMSMGRIGTDVAKESSEVILADDNFATIVNAIEEGRIVFNNVQRASMFLVTTNFAEYLTIIGALALGYPLPLLPTQILWLNLVTEGLPDVSLAAEPSHGRALKEPPRDAKVNVLSKQVIPMLLLMTVTMAILSLVTFVIFLPEGLEKARAAVFAVLAGTQLFNVFNMRSLHRSVFSIGLFSNKWLLGAFVASFFFLLIALYVPKLQEVFSFESLSLFELVILLAVSAVVLIIGEAYKFFRFRNYAKEQ